MKYMALSAAVALSAMPWVVSAVAIHSENSASAATGGVTAGPGMMVQTGPTEARVQTVTTVQGGYATSTVEITTVENGETHHEMKTTVQPSANAAVNASAKAVVSPVATATSASRAVPAATATSELSASTTMVIATPSLPSRAFAHLRSLFSVLLSWFW